MKTLNTVLHSSLMTKRQIQVTLLLVATLIIATYFLLRYEGYWAEADTRSTTWAIRDVNTTGKLVPGSGYFTYPNGYGFQALAVFLVQLTGISIVSLQLLGSALLSTIIIIPAWLLYRELTDSTRGATLASVILLVQPEFLFVIVRGTHEKFTRALMLLSLYILVRSLRRRGSTFYMAAAVVTFYTLVYAIITLNNLLATSYIAALILALFLQWASSRWSGTDQVSKRVSRRLFSTVAISLILAFFFTFYAYEPAQHDVQVMNSIVDRVSALLLDVGRESTDPYTKWVNNAWTSTSIYFILTLSNWILLIASASLWFGLTFSHVRKGKAFSNNGELLLWALYGAFAFQGAASILVDISGAIASNLQHRTFPAFAMLAAPLIARYLIRWHPVHQSLKRWSVAVCISLLAILSILKASNEPLVSNKWLFYSTAEMQSIDWLELNLPEQRLWSGFDERLRMGAFMWNDAERPNIEFIEGQSETSAQAYLVSSLISLRAVRLSETIPIQSDSLLTYHNGTSAVYRPRPVTPFQR